MINALSFILGIGSFLVVIMIVVIIALIVTVLKIKKTVDVTKNSTDQWIHSVADNLSALDEHLIRTIDENKKELYHAIDGKGKDLYRAIEDLRSSCKSYVDSRFDKGHKDL